MFVERVMETLTMHRSPTVDDYWSLSVIGVDRITRAFPVPEDVVFQGSLPSDCVGGSFACIQIDYALPVDGEFAAAFGHAQGDGV